MLERERLPGREQQGRVDEQRHIVEKFLGFPFAGDEGENRPIGDKIESREEECPPGRRQGDSGRTRGWWRSTPGFEK